MIQKNKSHPLVIFDLVSTLTDAGPRYAKAFQDVCQEYGLKSPNEDNILDALGDKNISQIMDQYAQGLPENKKTEFMNRCNSCCDSMLYDIHWHEALFPNVRSSLKRLIESGFKLGIYTGTREDTLGSQLKYHNIGEYFEPDYVRAKDNQRDGFIKNDELKRQQLQSIMTAYTKELRMGNKKAVIVVGDSIADYKAAKSLGLRFIGFASNDNKRMAFVKAGATHIFTDFSQIHDMLLKNVVAKPRQSYTPKF